MKYGYSSTAITITLILLILTGIMFAGCNTKTHSQLERENRMLNSPQFKDGKFVNPIDVPMMAPGSTWKYIKKQFFTSRIGPKPKGELPLKPIQSNEWIGLDKSDLFFAWLGHSSILITMDGKTILVDPVFEKRASPFSWIGPKRFHPPPVIAKDLPPIDVVLITHDHYDHLEKTTVKHMNGKTGLFLVPLGMGELFEDWGIAPEKVKELDWWEQHVVGSLTFIATPGVHYARRGLFDGDERLWSSWSIHGQKRKLFVSGDSGYFDEFKEVGEKFGPFDITFLKIGSYDDMWKQVHMTPEEAVQQHRDLGGSILVPLHWATFDLALHPWYEPIERALAAAEKSNVQVITPLIGERVELNHLPESNAWWRSVDNR
ncbi:MAG: hydrolase [Deltaproteobacteria bacterium]|nr:MAG: hydrolase [Deltaproteobacteria bacterium]